MKPFLIAVRAHRGQRGLAATAAALLLFLVMGIVVAFTNRNLIFEQRTSANQYRYTKAFEAAEAGLEWATVSLNSRKKVNASCLPDATGADAFRERYLIVNPTTAAIAINGAPPRAVCTISPATHSLTCSCPTGGSTAIAASADSGPAFMVTYTPTATNGIVRVEVTGCTSAQGPCHPDLSTGAPDGTAKVSALLGIIPALGPIPGATITARGTVGWTGAGAGLGVVNDRPEYNGITIDAGGAVDPAKARLTTIPGSPPASSIIQNDASLAGLSADQMFQTFFDMTKAQYKAIAQQSGAFVTCPNNCTNTLTTAIDALGQSARIVWVDNDMDISGNVVIGDVNNPVMLVVNGNITLNGTMQVVGLVYAASATWNNTGGGSAFLRGAAVTEGNFTGNGAPDFYFDPNVLGRLGHIPGNFVRLPGSWKDF